MSTPIKTTYQFLAPNPKSAYKQLFIKGTRIRARTLYGLYLNADEPMTPDEIAAEYGLPLQSVQEAIAYCQADPPEIRQDFEAEEALAEATGMNHPDYRYHPSPKILSPEEMARLNRL
jgi:uncharacterized protein (DUF433 family)